MINRVLPEDRVLSEAIRAAEQMAVVDPMVLHRTKQAVNAAMRTIGMVRALEDALATDLDIAGESSPDKAEFLKHLREGGLKAALARREARFSRG